MLQIEAEEFQDTVDSEMGFCSGEENPLEINICLSNVIL